MKNLSVTLLVAIFMTVFISTNTAWAASTYGVLRVVKGKVQVKSGKTGKSKKARMGQKVYPKDTIITGKDSRVKIVMIDKNEINISPNSKMEIARYEFNDKSKKAPKNVLLNVIYGKVRNKVNQKYDGKKSKFQIKTPSAVAGVRGTDFFTSYKPSTRQTQVVTFKGQVAFGLPGANGSIQNPVQIRVGQMANTTAGAAPAPPINVPKNQLASMDRDSAATPADQSENKRRPANQDKQEKKKQKGEDKPNAKKDGDSADKKGSKKEAKQQDKQEPKNNKRDAKNNPKNGPGNKEAKGGPNKGPAGNDKGGPKGVAEGDRPGNDADQGGPKKEGSGDRQNAKNGPNNRGPASTEGGPGNPDGPNPKGGSSAGGGPSPEGGVAGPGGGPSPEGGVAGPGGGGPAPGANGGMLGDLGPGAADLPGSCQSCDTEVVFDPIAGGGLPMAPPIEILEPIAPPVFEGCGAFCDSTIADGNGKLTIIINSN